MKKIVNLNAVKGGSWWDGFCQMITCILGAPFAILNGSMFDGSWGQAWNDAQDEMDNCWIWGD